MISDYDTMIHLVDRLAGVSRKLDCPICRKSSLVPDLGFPVCGLTERIKDELKIARKSLASTNNGASMSKGEFADNDR